PVMKRRVTLIPVLTTIVAVLVLGSLGAWQVKRLVWKEALITDIMTKREGGTVPFPPEEALRDPAVWVYRPVTVTGTFDHAEEMTVITGVKKYGRETGFFAVTPLRVEGEP